MHTYVGTYVRACADTYAGIHANMRTVRIYACTHTHSSRLCIAPSIEGWLFIG